MRLTLRDKLGYAAAGVTDSANFTFMNSYMLFFLTTIARINPATAGVLVAAGSIISSLWSPIVGFLSDRADTRFGKRRPFLMAASIPLALSLILCFTRIGSADAVRNVYYGILIVMFWCSFSTFYSPWLALGAEYTSDYTERTELRSVTYGVTLMGTVFGIAVPPVVIDMLKNSGMSESRAWQTMAVIIAAIAFCALNIAIASSARKDRQDSGAFPSAARGLRKLFPCEAARSLRERGSDAASAACAKEKVGIRDIKGLFIEYLEILKLKPTKFVIGACLCHITAQGIFFSDRLYFFTYNLGLSAAESTFAMLAFPVSGVILLTPILKVSKLLDKRTALMAFLATASAGCIIVGKIIGVDGFWGMAALTFTFVIGNSAFWQLMPVMIYDICEYDEYENNKRREGIIVSLQTVMETVCSGLATMVLGTILEFSGFDEAAAEQTESALNGVSFAVSVVPAIFMMGCVFMAYKYPITKRVFSDIKAAIDERRNQETDACPPVTIKE